MQIAYCTGPVCAECSQTQGDAVTDVENIPDGDVANACGQPSKMWRSRDELKVHFLNDKILSKWRIGNSPMNVYNILQWAQEWNSSLTPKIPKLVKTDSAQRAEIRVAFNGTCVLSVK